MYTIKQLAEHYQLPASTLRYYEQIGLLENVKRDDKKQRLYNDEHICRLDGIQCFKRAGMSISEIQEYYEYEKDLTTNIDNILLLIKNRESETMQRIAEMQSSLSHIREKIYYYDIVKQSIDSKEPIPSWDDIFHNNDEN